MCQIDKYTPRVCPKRTLHAPKPTPQPALEQPPAPTAHGTTSIVVFGRCGRHQPQGQEGEQGEEEEEDAGDAVVGELLWWVILGGWGEGKEVVGWVICFKHAHINPNEDPRT